MMQTTGAPTTKTRNPFGFTDAQLAIFEGERRKRDQERASLRAMDLTVLVATAEAAIAAMPAIDDVPGDCVYDATFWHVILPLALDRLDGGRRAGTAIVPLTATALAEAADLTAEHAERLEEFRTKTPDELAERAAFWMEHMGAFDYAPKPTCTNRLWEYVIPELLRRLQAA